MVSFWNDRPQCLSLCHSSTRTQGRSFYWRNRMMLTVGNICYCSGCWSVFPRSIFCIFTLWSGKNPRLWLITSCKTWSSAPKSYAFTGIELSLEKWRPHVCGYYNLHSTSSTCCNCKLFFFTQVFFIPGAWWHSLHHHKHAFSSLWWTCPCWDLHELLAKKFGSGRSMHFTFIFWWHLLSHVCVPSLHSVDLHHVLLFRAVSSV